MSIVELIQARIKEEGGENEIIELDLGGVKIGKITEEIRSAIEKCTELQILIMNNCELNSLENMPRNGLTAIDLSENNITDADLVHLNIYQDIGQILMTNNKIKTLNSLKTFSSFENLREVDFSENPVANEKNYREFLFKKYPFLHLSLPEIEVVDRLDKDGNEVEDDDQLQQGDEGEDGSEEIDDDDIDDDQEQSSSEKPQPKKK